MRGSRILIGAPKSGSGKTFLTCALLKACLNRKLKVKSYKCGPDYIDPMFHKYVLGIRGGNLDSYFSGEEELRQRVARETKDQDVTIIEGVMGYYDGMGGSTTIASTYDIARITRTPAVLIIDGKGMSLSMAALIRGFREFREDSQIKAVIANRTGTGMESRLRQIVEEAGCRFLGCFPEYKEWQWESRHLGLFLPGEMDGLQDTLEKAANEAEKHLDIDGLLAIGREAEDLDEVLLGAEFCEKKEKVRIAVALDEAFCFYYEENLDMLQRMGGELEFFSPLHDRKLPENIDGLLLGGGYPERCARQLSGNKDLRGEIRKMAESGMPVVGECGGFLYLLDELEGEDGIIYPMAGVLEGRGVKRNRLVRFGYGEFTAGKDSCFLRPGEKIKGHEFHYWDASWNGEIYEGKKTSGQSYSCIRRKYNTEAGFPHFYYPSSPSFAEGFLEKCREFHKKKG